MIKEDFPVSNREIDELYKDNNKYRSVKYIFELKDEKKIENGEFFIVAMDVRPSDGIMAHFVLIYRRDDTLVFFNSYGIDVPRQIMKFGSRSGCKLIEYNDTMYQGLSNLCGYYCCYVLDLLLEGKMLSEIVETLHEYPFVRKNKEVLINHYNDYKRN